MAGAEIVERERDTQLLKRTHRQERLLRIAHDAGLRDLEHEAVRRQADVLEHARDRVGETGDRGARSERG